LDFIKRTNSFLTLGQRFQKLNGAQFNELIRKANYQNPWFTPNNIKLAFAGLVNYLNGQKLQSWLKKYPTIIKERPSSNKVGIVMAGNIPIVGVHDLICVLISGHAAQVKLSSQDDVLMQFIINELKTIEPEYEDRIETTDQLKGMDAVIATGSNNTSRYFDYYFSKYPNIIRKNRTSAAVLTGDESSQDLQNLGNDIFSYFGLGCRNVSKLFLPEGYEIQKLIPHFEHYQDIQNHHKYANNYFYNRSIFLVNQTVHLDSGFALFRQTKELYSPISVIYYDFYKNTHDLIRQLSDKSENIQCIVSNETAIPNRIDFGSAQHPDIWDYADNVDTMEFLSKI
jgi:hypothetical protein